MPINSCPTTPVSANNNSNSNYNNLKYTENNYRDFQRAVKTDGVNSAPTTPSVTLPMFNVFEKNKSQTKLNFTNADSDISSVISNTTPAVNKNLTKIPLSPKSKKNKVFFCIFVPIISKILSLIFLIEFFFGKTLQHPLLRC